MRLSFIGTKYAGWQIQPRLPTIQGVLKETIQQITQEYVNLIGCSRTDAGVHALDYVANFKLNKEIDTERFLIALNSLLPDDIGVKDIKKVDDKFNARFSVRGKRYLYRIWNSKAKDPFVIPFSWVITNDLDRKAMAEAINLFKGEHDFKGFAKVENEEKNTVINIEEAYIEFKGEIIEIRIKASHFLRYMVRRIIGAVVNVGNGRISLEDIESFLSGKKCPFTAPAKGLFLEKVYD